MKFFAIAELSRKSIIIIFLLKILAGLAVWWVFVAYYPLGGDMKMYFNDSNILYGSFWINPSTVFHESSIQAIPTDLKIWKHDFEHVVYNDSWTIVMLNFLFRFFSFGYFSIHIVFINFLSLIGLVTLYKTFIIYFPDRKKIFFICIFLIPSVLFWGSGVLKEGLLFFALGMLLYTTNCGLATNYNWRKIVAVITSVFILLLIKFYVLFALIPGLFFNAIRNRFSEKWQSLKYLFVVSVLSLVLILLSFGHSDLNLLKIISDKQAKAISYSKGGVFLENEKYFICIDYDKKESQLILLTDNTVGNKYLHNKCRIKKGSNYLQWYQDNMRDTTFVKSSNDTSVYTVSYLVKPANTIVLLNKLKPDFFSVMQNIPVAFAMVLFQPFICSVKQPIQIIPAMENIVLLVLLVVAIIFFDRKLKHKSLLIFCLSFVVILFVLIGLTTPAIGSIVRFKTPALPFLFMAILLVIDKNKLLNKFPFLIKWIG
jgi:hypothetical protein